MTDQQLSQLVDLLFEIRHCRKVFLLGDFDIGRWDRFADSVQSDFRAHRDDPAAILPALIQRARSFRAELQIERARMLRALKVPGSDSVYQLDSSDYK